jgi:ribulose-phosphate 3-epimerase
MIKLSASILSADWLKLGEEIKRMEQSGCDFIHIDITDGHFVPNLTMGVDIAEAVCKNSTLRKDVHLMIARPQDFVKKFADVGADVIIFHHEATEHPFEMIKYINETGKMVGVALDPATRIEDIEHYLHAVDVVLLVAVCVGFGGQKYIETMDNKIAQLKKLREAKNLNFEIQIDGGINPQNAIEKHNLGADTLVAGTLFFLSENVGEIVKQLKEQ